MNFFIYLCLLNIFICQSLSWGILNRRHNFRKLRTASSSRILVKEYWFTQNVDHFNPADQRKWKQLYLVNDKYHNKSTGNTIFLFLGGESEIVRSFMTKGPWITYATKFGALCFMLEHRYYGKSWPTKDMSIPNLKYLTTQQALADAVFFINGMNEKYSLKSKANVKWIAFGGSYAGILATWMRLKYPHVLYGSVSSSAPLFIKVDFNDYYRDITEVLQMVGGNECIDAIREANIEIATLLKDQEGQKNISKMFRLCDPNAKPITKSEDVANLFSTLAENFAQVVQYHKVNDRFRYNNTSNIRIETVCSIMKNETLGVPMDRLAAFNSFLLQEYNGTCLKYKYDDLVENYKITNFSSPDSGARQWLYQTCTEFGFFQTSSQPQHVYGDAFPLDFFIKTCMDVFGPKYNLPFIEKGVNKINDDYGALDINVTNVIFIKNSLDPWRSLVIGEAINAETFAVYIRGTTHCADMYMESATDSQELKLARKTIEKYISNLIAN